MKQKPPPYLYINIAIQIANSFIARTNTLLLTASIALNRISLLRYYSIQLNSVSY